MYTPTDLSAHLINKAIMAKFQAIQPFDFSTHSVWTEEKTRFGRYRRATKLHLEDEDIQVEALIYSMGPEAENIFF